MLSAETPYSTRGLVVETMSCGRGKPQSILEAITQRDHYSYIKDEEIRSLSRRLTSAAPPQQTEDLDFSYLTLDSQSKETTNESGNGERASLLTVNKSTEIGASRTIYEDRGNSSQQQQYLNFLERRWGCFDELVTSWVEIFYVRGHVLSRYFGPVSWEMIQSRIRTLEQRSDHLNPRICTATAIVPIRKTIVGKADPRTELHNDESVQLNGTKLLSEDYAMRERELHSRTDLVMGSADRKQYYLAGEVNGRSVEAFPDSGADESFVSAAFVSKLGLKPKRRSQRKVRLANQKRVQSPGYVDLRWKFDGEERSQILKCWTLPGCVHGLIIGNGFMRASKTLTKFLDRIKSKILPSRKPKVRLLGCQQQRLWGSLNGSGIAAMPDTGSDIMLVSPAVATRHDMTVNTEPEHCLEIEMADGSKDRTMGCAKDVPWTVGNHTVRADFYVLRDLSVDVVLSKDYLFENNIFAAHEDAFFDAVIEDEILQLCNIRLIGKYGESLNILEEDWRADLNSPLAFSEEMFRKEVARRDLIRDRILELPEGQRESAFADELQRQCLWEQLRRAHDLRPVSIAPTCATSDNKTMRRSASERASLRLWWMRRFGPHRR